MRRFVVVTLIVAAVLFAYPVSLALRIWHQSRQDEVRAADAIVVLGAAQYDGRPSPVYRARLDHAVYLYTEGLSERVILTGGRRTGDRFSEAEAGHRYLVRRAVPDAAIVGEAQGATTLDSLREVRDIARQHDIDTVLLVSDPLHSERIKEIASDLGFDRAYASWASYQELQRSRKTKLNELVREVASLAAYELLER